jgi:hypothetical protein
MMLGLALSAQAQRGTGEQEGVAQQPQKPAIVTLEGTVEQVLEEECTHTTGRYKVGNHVLLKTDDEQTLNVHLGPAAVSAVESVAKVLEPGQTLRAKVFRTQRMAKDHYVAQQIEVDDKTYTLRDENLRPVWAGRGGGRGGNRGRR